MKKQKQSIKLDQYVTSGETSFSRGYKEFWPFLRPYALWAIIGLFLTIPVGALDAVVASFLKPFMDNVMIEQDSGFAYYVPLFIICFTMVQGLCIYASNVVNSFVASKVSLDIKLALYKKLLDFDSTFFDKNSSGSVIMRFCTDADSATGGLINNLKLFLQKFFSTVSLICVLFWNSWELSIIAVGVLVVIVIPMKLVRKKIKDITTKSLANIAKVNSSYVETYAGIKIIKSFNLQRTLFKKYHFNAFSVFMFGMKIIRDTNWLGPVMHLITAFGVSGVLYFGLHLIEIEHITPGGFVAFLAALIMLYTPMKSIGNNYIQVQLSLLAIDRVTQILESPTYEKNDGEGKLKLESINKNIKFENVSFSYDGERTVLKNINFEVPVGQKVALVGNSGGGKTTVTSLIPRLYEIDDGVISIDGTNVEEFTLSSLRENIAMVFQDNFLFDGTIKENLLYGKENATDDEIQFAIKSAFLDEFINKLPDGINTVIGERGLLLSGGQKQRVAIARAILKNAPLVILDEATSALDNKSEKVVQQALDKLMEGRTTIVIAHRLSTVMDADKIIVINDGQIVEQGRHVDLVEKNGPYAALYKSQFSLEKKNEDNQ